MAEIENIFVKIVELKDSRKHENCFKLILPMITQELINIYKAHKSEIRDQTSVRIPHPPISPRHQRLA